MDETGRVPRATSAQAADQAEIEIALGEVRLKGIVGRPASPCGLVVFAHGSGSGRLSSRNQFVATALQRDGFATALFDLLTTQEEARARETRHLRFDIALLAGCRLGVTRWLADAPSLVSCRWDISRGGDDTEVIALNRHALGLMTCQKALTIVPGATHLFEEPGALQEVTRLAGAWFTRHLGSAQGAT